MLYFWIFFPEEIEVKQFVGRLVRKQSMHGNYTSVQKTVRADDKLSSGTDYRLFNQKETKKTTFEQKIK